MKYLNAYNLLRDAQEGGSCLEVAVAGDRDDLVEVQVQVPEVRADDVPVRLLAQQVEGGEVHEDRLQVLGEGGGGVEP